LQTTPDREKLSKTLFKKLNPLGSTKTYYIKARKEANLVAIKIEVVN